MENNFLFIFRELVRFVVFIASIGVAAENAYLASWSLGLSTLENIDGVHDFDCHELEAQKTQSNKDHLRECIAAYEDFYKDDEVAIGIYGGYFDSKLDNQTLDIGHINQIAKQLVSSCGEVKSNYKKLCEFKSELIEGKEYFVKWIMGLDGKRKKIKISLTHSFIRIGFKNSE